MDTTALFAEILKYEKDENGDLLVHGRVSDETLDVDDQIADDAWLKGAMPEWFRWGNIREMHVASGVGKATEYAAKDGAHVITARIVDPLAKAKVEADIYTGFSIGIKGPRIVKDAVAKNGRIVGGKIVEVSLVDRPANPNCTLTLVKSASVDMEVLAEDFDEDRGLVRVEEIVDKSAKDAELAALATGQPAGESGTPTEEEFAAAITGEGAETEAVVDEATPLTEALGGTDKPKDKNATPDLVKAGPVTPELVRSVLASDEFRSTLTAEIEKTVRSTSEAVMARLEKVESMAAPGGPVRARTAEQSKQSMVTDHLREAAHYTALAKGATQNKSLQEGYQELAERAEAKAREAAPLSD